MKMYPYHFLLKSKNNLWKSLRKIIMIEKIDKKINEELEKLLSKEDLKSDEIQVLLSIKNDIKFDEKMKKIMEFTF